MTVVLAILSLGLLGLIIFFAFSPKSSRLLKWAAIIALVLIGLSIVVCGIFLILGPGQGTNDIAIPDFQDVSPKPASNGGIVGALISLVVLLAALVVVISLAMRNEQRTKSKSLPVQKAEKPKLFEDDDTFKNEFENGKEKDDDESFDIDIN